jgi:predicted acyl esterase
MHVAADVRVEQVMLTVRDGMTLARKRYRSAVEVAMASAPTAC